MLKTKLKKKKKAFVEEAEIYKFSLSSWALPGLFSKSVIAVIMERGVCILPTLCSRFWAITSWRYSLKIGTSEVPSGSQKIKEDISMNVSSFCGLYFLRFFLQWFEILYVLHFKLRTFWHLCKKTLCWNFNVACDSDVLLCTSS